MSAIHRCPHDKSMTTIITTAQDDMRKADTNNHTRVGALWSHHSGCDCTPVGPGKDTPSTLGPEREGRGWPERTTRRPQTRGLPSSTVAEQVTTTNSTCDGRPKNRSRTHQAAHDKMPKESPKDKPTNQLE